MSETPIGSIEFLVKFDTMGKEFTDALKEALDKSDMKGVGVPKETLDDIRSIKYNVESRLRSGFTGDRRQFLATAPAEILETRKDDFVIELAQTLMGSKTGKRIFPQFKEEEERIYLERMTETSKRIVLAYGKKIEDQIQNPSAQGMSELMTIQPAFQAALKGNWKYLTEKIIEKLLNESDWEMLMQDKLRQMGIITRAEGQGQLMWQKTTQNIGTGTNVIQTMGELMQALMTSGLTAEQAKDIYMGVQKSTPSIRDAMQTFYEENLIMAGANVPGSMLHTMKGLGLIGKEAWTTTGGIKPDLPYIIGQEFWSDEKNQKKFLELWDDPDTRKSLKEQIDEALKDSEFIAFIMEGKNILSYTKYLYETFKGREGPFFQMGGPGGSVEGIATATGPQYVPRHATHTPEEIKEMKLIEEMRHQAQLSADIHAYINSGNEHLVNEMKRLLEDIVAPRRINRDGR